LYPPKAWQFLDELPYILKRIENERHTGATLAAAEEDD
jgi:hypothetical protein